MGWDALSRLPRITRYVPRCTSNSTPHSAPYKCHPREHSAFSTTARISVEREVICLLACSLATHNRSMALEGFGIPSWSNAIEGGEGPGERAKGCGQANSDWGGQGQGVAANGDPRVHGPFSAQAAPEIKVRCSTQYVPHGKLDEKKIKTGVGDPPFSATTGAHTSWSLNSQP